MATVLGSGYGTGTSLVVTLTADVPADGILLGAFTIGTIGSQYPDNGTYCASMTDTAGGAWHVDDSGGYAVVGLIRCSAGAVGNCRTIVSGGSVRGVSAGGLVAGNTVSFTWGGSAYQDLLVSAALIIHVSATTTGIVQPAYGAVMYANGDDTSTAASPPTLSWLADFNEQVAPAVDATMLVVAGSYPTSHFGPLTATLVGEELGPTVSVAAAVEFVNGVGNPDPGGTFDQNDLLVANYQFAEPILIPPVPIHINAFGV